jgi:hypothetical protein
LGEVVKKVIELEFTLASSKENVSVLTMKLASYNLVLAAWPVQDKAEAKIAIQGFRLLLQKFREDEARLDTVLYKHGTEMEIVYHSLQYMNTLQKVRAQMLVLNSMGQWIGDSPWLEIT